MKIFTAVLLASVLVGCGAGYQVQGPSVVVIERQAWPWVMGESATTITLVVTDDTMTTTTTVVHERTKSSTENVLVGLVGVLPLM